MFLYDANKYTNTPSDVVDYCRIESPLPIEWISSVAPLQCSMHWEHASHIMTGGVHCSTQSECEPGCVMSHSKCLRQSVYTTVVILSLLIRT